MGRVQCLSFRLVFDFRLTTSCALQAFPGALFAEGCLVTAAAPLMASKGRRELSRRHYEVESGEWAFLERLSLYGLLQAQQRDGRKVCVYGCVKRDQADTRLCCHLFTSVVSP
ncbi:hypothetical protein NDU88_008907 [Pleurodeles waltl]|uniref:Secreted protein n=1 Tax=Pleurodeles waltl TaxID=8319 RepID=A0AAV7PT08_PLEWA|nr:hypothetical protein NDU88_008907 [Pleurodeles waltl]